jgi:hypothetical protein
MQFSQYSSGEQADNASSTESHRASLQLQLHNIAMKCSLAVVTRVLLIAFHRGSNEYMQSSMNASNSCRY